MQIFTDLRQTSEERDTSTRRGLEVRGGAAVLLLSAALLQGCGQGSGASVEDPGNLGPSPGGAAPAGGASGASSVASGGGTINATGGSAPEGAGTAGSATSGTAGTAMETGGGAGTATEGGSGGTVASGGSSGTPSMPDWGTPVTGGPTGTGVSAAVTVDLGTAVGTIGSDFGGFSYEKTHIVNGSLTSTNASLVALYKLVGSPSMRLGADDVDESNWIGTGDAPAKPTGEPFSKSISTGMVDQLCSFLSATATKVLYGVNFKSDDVKAAAEEAAYVMGKCGSSVYGFEIGNEINRYGAWATLKSQWEAYGTAITATPGALLIGPVAGGGDALSLSTPFAADESVKFGSKLVLLTQHYYAGTANTTTATVARIQTPDYTTPTSTTGLVGTDSIMNAAAVKYKIPNGYRLGECNTFSGHGQMGVSDTLIAGLWGMDLMFVTAENGGSGVNLHGGEAGMDGSRPFFYEPIMESGGVVVAVQPIYYSLLLLNLAGTGAMVSTTVTTSNPNFTAYAIKANGFISVVLDNKNATSGVSATVNLGAPVASASGIYLQGTPSGSLSAAASTVTLAGAPVMTNGTWNRNPPYVEQASGDTVSVYIPPASAALVRVLQ
jgi:hypothetical protein